jgi:hypothetical protein
MLILNDVEEVDFVNIKRAFSILYLISEKVGYFSIYRSGSSRIIQDMLLRPGDLDLLFDPLRSLVAQESEEENLHVFHKTLFDFLLDSESQRFTVTSNRAADHHQQQQTRPPSFGTVGIGTRIFGSTHCAVKGVQSFCALSQTCLISLQYLNDST